MEDDTEIEWQHTSYIQHQARNTQESARPGVMHQRQVEYLEAIKPFVQAKTRLFSLTMSTTIIIHADGEIEHQHNFTPEQKKSLRQMDEAIASIKTQIFGA